MIICIPENEKSFKNPSEKANKLIYFSSVFFFALKRWFLPFWLWNCLDNNETSVLEPDSSVREVDESESDQDRT